MKRSWLWILSGAATLVALALLAPNEKDFRGVPASSLSAGPAGAKGLYRFLGAMGLEVRRWQSRNYRDLPDGTLWILSQEPIPSLRVEALGEFLDRGNTVIGTFEAVKPLLEKEQLTDLSRDFLPTVDLRRESGGALEASKPHSISGTPLPDQVFASGKAPNKEVRPVIAGWHASAGEIVVLGADDIVRNDQIGLAENGPFLLDLAMNAGREDHRIAAGLSPSNRPQIFDEIATGVAVKSMGELFAELPYRYGLVEAALALLVLLLGALPRRALVDPTPAPTRRTTVEHLEAVARLWRRSKDPGLPLSELLAAMNERSAHRGGAGVSPFADWVARQRADLATRAAEVVARAEALSRGVPTVAAARAAAVDLMALEREASQW